MEVKTTAVIGTVGYLPGIKMDATCPIPPGGLPKLGNDITSGIKQNPALQLAKPATSPDPLAARSD